MAAVRTFTASLALLLLTVKSHEADSDDLNVWDEHRAWVPMDILETAGGLMVDLVKSDSMHLLNSEKRQLDSAPDSDRTAVSLSEFVDINLDTCDSLPIPLLMLKVGRSGSTIVTDLLALDSRFKLVEEPAIFNRFIKARGAQSDEPSDEGPEVEDRDVLEKMLRMLACRTSPDQEVAFFNLNSQNIWFVDLLKDALPDARFVYLWREAIDVAASLYEHTPAWIAAYNGVTKAEKIRTYMETAATFVTAREWIQVEWYSHVLNLDFLEALYWTTSRYLGISSLKLDRRLKKDMYERLAQDVDTGPHDIEYPDYYLDEIPEALKNQCLYNPKLVQFKLDHGRVFLSKRESDPIPVLDWRDEFDRQEAVRIIVSANDGHPIVIRHAIDHWPWSNINRLGWEGLTKQYVHKWKDGTVDVLEANHRENWFMWHSEKGCNKAPWKDSYRVSSRWDSITLPEFFRRRDVYIISHKDAGNIEHSDFGYDAFHWKLPRALYDAMKYQGADKGPWSWRASYPGQVSPLHFDHGASLLIQLHGSKHIMFWSRENVLNGKMNIYPKSHCMFRRVLEHGVSPDRRLFPHHDSRDTVQAELNQGDIVYFPSMWPHYTTATSKSISVGKRSHSRLKDDAYGGVMVQLEKNISPPWATVDEAERRRQFAKGWAIDRKAIFKEMEAKGTYDDPMEWYIPP